MIIASEAPPRPTTASVGAPTSDDMRESILRNLLRLHHGRKLSPEGPVATEDSAQAFRWRVNGLVIVLTSIGNPDVPANSEFVFEIDDGRRRTFATTDTIPPKQALLMRQLWSDLWADCNNVMRKTAGVLDRMVAAMPTADTPSHAATDPGSPAVKTL